MLANFKRAFYLVGGTLIAIRIGYTISIDFGLFKHKPLRKKIIPTKISSSNFPYIVTRNVAEQLNIFVNNVKFTFFEFLFIIVTPYFFENIIKLPNLLTLTAIKAYALGRRSKWIDCIDLFFIPKEYVEIGLGSEGHGNKILLINK